MLKGSYSWYTVDAYDAKGRLARQTVDGSPIDYEYTRRGQLAGKYLGGKLNPDAVVVYEYSKSGQITARTANGVRQTYEYDKKGQLLGVKEGEEYVERYAYDRAGNMTKKVVRGSRFVVRDGVEALVRDGEDKVTTFTFDDANQLVSSTCDGVTTRYEYDAAGRMIKEGDKTYTYGYLDKVMSVRDGANTYTYAYHPDGQLARANYGRARSPSAPQGEDSPSFETFAWDGLALIQRGSEQFINEPHIGGGNPVVSSKGTSYFNDMLGTTVGAKSGKQYSAATLSAFGEDLTHHSPTPTSHSNSFFTGKPVVEGLGHAFLMRNYRAGLGKWQTADPMGYPDGWNQLAYCNNRVTSAVDLWGCILGFGDDDDDPVVSTRIEHVVGDESAILNSLTPLGQEVHCGEKSRSATIKLGSAYTFDFKVSLTKAFEKLAEFIGVDLSDFLSFDFEYKIQNLEFQYVVPGYTCAAEKHNQHGDDQGEEIVVPYFQALAYIKIEIHQSGRKVVSDAKVYDLAIRTKCIDLTNCKE